MIAMSPCTELVFTYDENMKPLWAQCSRCGEHMPLPPLNLEDTADIFLWFSGQFLEHKKRKHPPDKSAE